MLENQVETRMELSPWWMMAAIGAGLLLALLAAALVAWIVWRLLRSSAAEKDHFDKDLSIDIGALPMGGPPANAKSLEFYGKPVRVAVLVVAPLGRGSGLPENESLRAALDELVPGLMTAIDVHRPVFRRWPEQLSWNGFTQSFFANMRLPGERKGKETPWCSIAGKLETGGPPLLAGMVLCADEPNLFTQVVAEHRGQWLDVLRMRRT